MANRARRNTEALRTAAIAALEVFARVAKLRGNGWASNYGPHVAPRLDRCIDPR